MMTLFYIFSICIVVQTCFAVWMLWASPSDQSAAKTEGSAQALSIIICAHNEAQNLAQNLPLVLQQSHPQFEVIVVNDRSDDDSGAILKELASKHPQLKLVEIGKEEERLFPGKKMALSRGIAAASQERLLLCDADCSPASKDWATLMSDALQEPIQIVAGYGAYRVAPGWLNTFIRWETVHTFLQYGTYAQSGIPYMAVGRNLACHKSLLLQAQAHPLWSSMPSGDDDLLIRLTAHKKNMRILATPDSFTLSDSKATFGEWLHQKQRHLSTGKLYRRGTQFLLGIYAASHGLMWLLWLLLWIGGLGYLISSLMLLRCMLVWCLWAISAYNLKEKKLILWLPLCDVAWAIYHLILSPYIFFKTKKQWT